MVNYNISLEIQENIFPQSNKNQILQKGSIRKKRNLRNMHGVGTSGDLKHESRNRNGKGGFLDTFEKNLQENRTKIFIYIKEKYFTYLMY